MTDLYKYRGRDRRLAALRRRRGRGDPTPVRELAREYGVAPKTIYRDLHHLRREATDG